jgi:hypothetical protein
LGQVAFLIQPLFSPGIPVSLATERRFGRDEEIEISIEDQ